MSDICTNCSGTGEGMSDGTRCSVCHGVGVEQPKSEKEAYELLSAMKEDFNELFGEE